MLVARLVGPVAPLLVNADDVIDAAAVAGHADHRRRRSLRVCGKQEVREHADAGPAVEHDFLAPVAGERAGLECDGPERLALEWKDAKEIDQPGPQLLLPLLGLASRAGLETEAARRRGVQVAREGHRIESAAVEALGDSREGTDVAGRRGDLSSERHGTERRQGREHPRELTTGHFSHGDVFPNSL